MGSLFSVPTAKEKYVFRPIESHPVSSFDSILGNKNEELWYKGFRCPDCGFYLEKGVLRIGF